MDDIDRKDSCGAAARRAAFSHGPGRADRVEPVPLSPAGARLEEAGVIADYRANLNPSAVGLNFSAIVFVTLRVTDRAAVQAFEDAVPQIPEIIQAQRLFGDPDFLLHVVTTDLAAYQKLYDYSLSTLPSVQRLTSTLVMRNVVQNRALPI